MSDTILVDENSENKEGYQQKFLADDMRSEISAYSMNLRLASSSDLHQDLLFYQIQLDSLRDKVIQPILNVGKADQEIAEKARMISAKIRAVEDEIERRRKSLG